MTKRESLQLFEERKVRTAWDSNEEKWYFSIIDVVAVLTDSADYQTARNYWKVLKNRLTAEGNETVTKCNQFKMRGADGKRGSQGAYRRVATDWCSRGSRVRDTNRYYYTNMEWTPH